MGPIGGRINLITVAKRSPYRELLAKVENHSALVGVVGLGYVGLPFAVEKAKVGFRVIGVEQNPRRADRVNQMHNYINDVKDDELKHLVSTGKLTAVTGFERVAEMDIIVICVPTPLTKNLVPDLSHIENVTREIAKHLRPGQLISLESTTYPGTTDDVMRPVLEQVSGLRQGEDFFLAHSPERVDPGNKRYTTKNTNKVVGASDSRSLEVATAFYQQTIDHVVPVSSAKAAELVKVFENTFRAVNIALVNELALLCDRFGRRPYQTLWNHALFSWPWHRWTLHPHRSSLSGVESQGTKLQHPLYRTCRRDQSRHAGVCPHEGLACSQ
jgi:UDP-N-acetyl-D-glucosamine dehydrogenase